MYDWLLFLHLLAALMVFATVVIFSAVALGATRDARVLPVGNLLWDIGGAGLLVFGIWLALYVDGYEIWDGWILGALVLFAIVTELGRRARVGYVASDGSNAMTATSSAALMHWLRTIGVIAILVLMIYKPGA